MIRASASAVINVPPEEVFRFVIDPSNEPTWHTDVAEAELIGGGTFGPGRRVRYVFPFAGRRTEGSGEVVGFEPGQLVRLRFKGVPMDLDPVVTLAVEPAAGGSRFTRTVEIEPHGFKRLLAPLLGGFIAKRNAGFVANLKRRLEDPSSPRSALPIG